MQAPYRYDQQTLNFACQALTFGRLLFPNPPIQNQAVHVVAKKIKSHTFLFLHMWVKVCLITINNDLDDII